MADTLYRPGTEELHLAALSGPSFQLFADLCAELEANPELRTLRNTITTECGDPRRIDDGFILRGSRVLIPP